MIFTETKLKDAYLIEIERLEDERGFFARWFDHEIFHQLGLNPNVLQSNISFNKHKATLRGMHYQAAPFEEAKLVRCTMGAIYDVIIDLRPDSDTYTQSHAETLSASNHKMVFVPEGFAHGYQTLEDNSEMTYQVSEMHHPESARGVRWNDPAFGIDWPEENPIILTKDQSYPNFIA